MHPCTILLVTIVPFSMHMCLQKFVAPSSMGAVCLDVIMTHAQIFRLQILILRVLLSMPQRDGRQEHGTWFFTDVDGVDGPGIW